MEENVLFKPNQSQSAGRQPPMNQQASYQTSGSTTPPPSNNPPSPPSSPPPPIRQKGNLVGLLLKISVALIVLGVVAFLVFRFVLPLFSGSGSNERVTLTYWGLWESESTMQALINDFQNEYPNITVVYEKRDIDKYRQTLQTRITQGDGPDVFLFHNSWTPVMRSFIAPISSDVMAPEEFEEVYYPVIQNDLTIEGAIYGIPMGIDTLALFVNDAIFDETGATVPRTWEDFTNVSAGVTVKDGENAFRTYGASFGSFDNVNRAPDLMSLLFLQNQVDLQNPEPSMQSIQEALRFYTDFVTGFDNIEPVWERSAPPALVSFAGGNVGMYFGYSWDIFTIKQISPELSFSIHPVPQLQNDMTIASYWVNGVSSQTQHQQAAQTFLAYLARRETQEKLYTETSKVRLFGLPPARRDMAASVQDNPFVYPFVSQAETAQSSYFVGDTQDEGLNDQMNAYLGNAVRSVLENTSPDSAAETLVSGMNEVLGQYGIN